MNFKGELDRLIQQIFAELRTDFDLINHLYDSLERRFQYVLDNNGDWCV